MAYVAVNLAETEISDEEGQLLAASPADGARASGVRRAAAVVAVALGLSAVACGLEVVAASRGGRSHHPPLTVRGLLASDELRDLTAENLAALHGVALVQSEREHLREQVSRSLSLIDAALEHFQPETHRQLNGLKVGDDQRASALLALRKLGDPRMVRLSKAISRAVDEDGDDEELSERRLAGALISRLDDLAQLHAEALPGAASLPGAGHEDPGAKYAPGAAAGASEARRLSTVDGVSDGVTAHAQALFESLEGGMGGKMPKAPARMLSMLSLLGKVRRAGASSVSRPRSGDGREKFMSCIMDAAPNPTRVAKCIADNMSEVMRMVARFAGGKRA